MLTRISKLTLSAAMAFGLALTPVPAAADADREDIARALAGLAILGVIASAANNRSNRNNDRYRGSQYGDYDNYRRQNDRVIDGELRRRPNNQNARNRGFRRAALPERCLRVLNTGRGDRWVYGQRCLNRNFKFAGKLPERCERRVRTNRGVRTVFGARCLSRDGWRVSRR